MTLELNSRSSPTKWMVSSDRKTKLDISEYIIQQPSFHGDHIKICETCNNIKVFHSDITNKTTKLPGTLVLETNKTFGRVLNNSLKRYYRFFPHDHRYPIFYVPFKLNDSFCKRHVNKYIIIEFKSYNKTNKMSYGQIHHIIGDVNVVENIYTYMMYCNNIVYKRSQLNSFFRKTIDFEDLCSKYDLQDRRPQHTVLNGYKYKIISIDPTGCLDIDDACSLTRVSDTDTVLSVYISNVAIIMDYLNGLNVLKEHLKQTSTIYLPTTKLSMIPSNLSDGICSLIENENRVVIAMDIHLNVETGAIKNIEFHNAIIKVNDNLTYDECTQNNEYKQILHVVSTLNQNVCTLINDAVLDSHRMIEYLMLFMNIEISKRVNMTTGIYRVSEEIKRHVTTDLNDIPVDLSTFMKIYCKYNSYYSTVDIQRSSQKDLKHEILDVDSYMQITSPIRRIGDLVNQILFIQTFSDIFIHDTKTFCQYMMSPGIIDHINDFNKKSRKVQNNAQLIHHLKYNKNATNKIYRGYFINNEGLVYIPELKLIKNTKQLKTRQFEPVNLKIYTFYDESNVERKWRVVVQ